MYIIAILIICICIIILYLILFKKEEYFTNKKNLVFTSAGNNTSFDTLWTNYNRNYDIWVVYYGDDDNRYNQYKNKVNKIWKRKGSKFQNFNYIYTNYYNELLNYDRFFIVDDDIIIKTDDINKLFDISIKYNLFICQPAFLPESKISHHITKVRNNNILRYTNFVEVNTPVFSKEALIKFMKYYDDILIGWGIDYLYIWANGRELTDKYAIIDSITCINPHDNIKGDIRELNQIKNSNLRAKIWEDYANKIGADIDWIHKVYSKIPLLK